MEATVSTSTGVSTPAPVIATGSAEPTPAQRPTFAEAFASDATPSTDTAAPPEAATTAQAAAIDPTGVHPSPETKEGPIPFVAHKTALENARVKEREAVAKEWEPYAWAKQVPQASLDRMSNIAQRMTTDRVGFLDSYYQEVANDPQSAAEVRSWAAKTLGSKQGRSVANDVPDVEIVGADNQVIGNLKDIVQRVVDAQTGPLKEAEARRVAAQQETDRRAEIQAWQAKASAQTDATLDELKDIVGWASDTDDALLAEIGQLLAKDPALSPHKAAIQVRKAKVDPTRDAKSQAAVLDTFKTKAAANAVNPASAVVASTNRPRSFLDSSLKW